LRYGEFRNQQVAGSNPASSSKNAATAYTVAAFLSIFPLLHTAFAHRGKFFKILQKILDR